MLCSLFFYLAGNFVALVCIWLLHDSFGGLFLSVVTLGFIQKVFLYHSCHIFYKLLFLVTCKTSVLVIGKINILQI